MSACHSHPKLNFCQNKFGMLEIFGKNALKIFLILAENSYSTWYRTNFSMLIILAL